MPQSMTYHLKTLTPTSFQRATTHPFLHLAGSGKIPKPLLSKWLSQDRLYAQSYVRFIGLLLAKINLPRTPSRTKTKTAQSGTGNENEKKGGDGDGDGDVNEKILAILIAAINNIQEELCFFEDVAAEYNLDLNKPFESSGPENENENENQNQNQNERFGPSPITHAYIDMFMAAGSPGVSLLEGLVVLWATEICYLGAWKWAAGFLGESLESSLESEEEEEGTGDADGGALRQKFIPNWSSEGFEGFVERIGGVLDEVAVIEVGVGSGDGEGLERCERWWRQVVWLEERFWPDVDGVGV
ncbi:hypothetical protein BJX70DRAFT_397924 [Aspergillus crustosus]